MPPEEGIGSTCIDVPNPSNRPLLHPIEHLERRALLELRPIAEAWINHHNHENQHHDDDYNYDDGNQWTMQRTERKKERVERKHLIGNNAYGLRIYKNGSRLNMHVDKSGTHVVSAILHVDHDANSKPWPIVIEDYQGNLNEVVLEKGDVLLYESSKCFHGRPRRFEGEWYTSLFIHYYPSDWKRIYNSLDVHYRIPPEWNTILPPQPGLEQLVMAETSALEPECEDTWCSLNDTIKWDVRGEFGRYVSGDGVVRDLDFGRKSIRTPRHWEEEL
mmetsp:Transcript_6422/g.12392  ORF Transcript_6422/g.12392 Transcript_6422/m.12392 type:complete len:274 (+) Transcript_6422:203-1024(+)